MFCKQFKKLRQENGYTQAKIGKEFNVSQSTISNWEHAMREPSLMMICKISNFFNVTVEYLVCMS